MRVCMCVCVCVCVCMLMPECECIDDYGDDCGVVAVVVLEETLVMVVLWRNGASGVVIFRGVVPTTQSY